MYAVATVHLRGVCELRGPWRSMLEKLTHPVAVDVPFRSGGPLLQFSVATATCGSALRGYSSQPRMAMDQGSVRFAATFRFV